MISNPFANLPTITKNLLIINALMLLATVVLANQHMDLIQLLGAHNFLSPLFEPYQIVTHFFMHADWVHLFFNMFGLIMFGSYLERVWGPKRFFWFYIISALGALFFYAGYGTWEMYQIKQQLVALGNGNAEFAVLNSITEQAVYMSGSGSSFSNFVSDTLYQAHLDGVLHLNNESYPLYLQYVYNGYMPMVGASGAIYGVLVGFATLFPNTQLMLLFPPIPIKAKYLVGILMAFSLYYSFNDDGSNVAHLAHLGGGVVGFILVMLMKRDRNSFY